ncbi:MAG: hypothetical protein AAGG72_06680 [Pseudomonadota bacterium]
MLVSEFSLWDLNGAYRLFALALVVRTVADRQQLSWAKLRRTVVQFSAAGFVLTSLLTDWSLIDALGDAADAYADSERNAATTNAKLTPA